jgi:hypothetical protein
MEESIEQHPSLNRAVPVWRPVIVTQDFYGFLQSLFKNSGMVPEVTPRKGPYHSSGG